MRYAATYATAPSSGCNRHVTTGVQRVASRICTTVDTPTPSALAISCQRLNRDGVSMLKPISVAALSLLLLGWSKQAGSSLLWEWNYTGPAVSASGTFTTDDKPDADGFYHIIGITGTADGGRITGLQAAGTAIPGNSGFPSTISLPRLSRSSPCMGLDFWFPTAITTIHFSARTTSITFRYRRMSMVGGQSRQSTSWPHPCRLGEPVRPRQPLDEGLRLPDRRGTHNMNEKPRQEVPPEVLANPRAVGNALGLPGLPSRQHTGCAQFQCCLAFASTAT
jgi:hypothetical protein